METKNAQYGPTVLRIFIGLLFLVVGLNKLTNPSGIIGLLGNIGFPVPTFFGWLVLLSEIVFGISLILGWKVKYTVWPLVAILVGAVLFVVIRQFELSQPLNLLWHLLGIAGLVSLFLTGPGAGAVSKD